MHQHVGDMFKNFLRKLNTLYSKRAGKIISLYAKMTIFGIILTIFTLSTLSKKIHLIPRVRSCAFAQKAKFYGLNMLKKTKSHSS